ncbi:MAG: amidohydrolase [Burkholderiales bacterium]|nr:amidohydrolase [Anaerolineae bacterium]
MIVDAHLHVWRAAPNYDAKTAPVTTAVSSTSDVPVELLLEYMDEYGVDRAALVQPMFPGEDNSYVADSAAANPERFTAVCIIDPRTPGTEDRLEYWVRERGCKGLRLRPRFKAEEAIFGSPATYPLWERIRALNVVVNVLANPEHLATTAALAGRYSDVPIIVDHMGHPDVNAGVDSPAFQALLDLAQFPQVFVKVTGHYYYSRQRYPYADCHDLFRALYDRFGPSRLIWGSDFPHVLFNTTYRRCLLLNQREFPFLSAANLELIMGENAAKLYW